MCGLVGVFGLINSVGLETIFEELLIIDALRGKDSTGVAIVNNDKAKPKIIKGAVSPLTIINNAIYEKAKVGQHILMMGHNRAATIGKPSDKNAHPFRAKHITLAHNGTILPGCDILKDSKFETDSEAICNLIADEGIEAAYSKLNGAVTLTYWDEKEKTFNFLSDGKRTFYFAYNKEKDVMFYASEMWMIRVVTERNKELLYKEDDTSIWFPPKNTLFSFRLKKNKVTYETTKLKEFERTWQGWGGDYRKHYDAYENDLYSENILPFFNKNKQQQSKNVLTVVNKIQKIDKDTGTYKVEYEHLLASKKMEEKEFQKQHKECVLCKESVIDDYETTVIVDDKVAICKDCVFLSYVHNLPLETVYKT